MQPPPATPAPWAAIVLAGGAGRRMGGTDKPALRVGSRTLLDTALDAVAGCARVVVVGPERPTGHRRVTWTREDPPGSGPAAALARGLQALAALDPGPPATAEVAVLAADLPGVTPGTIARLLTALRPASADDAVLAAAPSPAPPAGPDGAVLADDTGRDQPAIAVWRLERLAAAVATRDDWGGASLRALLAPLTRASVPAVGEEASDVDTPEDARRWRVEQPR